MSFVGGGKGGGGFGDWGLGIGGFGDSGIGGLGDWGIGGLGDWGIGGLGDWGGMGWEGRGDWTGVGLTQQRGTRFATHMLQLDIERCEDPRTRKKKKTKDQEPSKQRTGPTPL